MELLKFSAYLLDQRHVSAKDLFLIYIQALPASWIFVFQKYNWNWDVENLLSFCSFLEGATKTEDKKEKGPSDKKKEGKKIL